MAATLSTRQKRFLTDLKKRIAVFPCDTSSSGLSYADFLKLDKRANEVGIDASHGGERLQWLRSTLDSLEQWASHAIEADQSKDIRAIREIIELGESTFSRAFIRSVPLFKLVTRANRKRLKLLEEYELHTDEWLPVSMSTMPVSQLEGILTEDDLSKLSSLYSRWGAFVSSGYFDLQAALELLRGLHESDLHSHSSFPLLQKALKLLSLDLSKIDARPINVRVRPSVIAKLIAVVALSPAFGNSVEIPATYATEVKKAIERANDAQYRKLCDQSLNLLLVRTYPQKVAGLLAFVNRPYGSPNPIAQKNRKSNTFSKKSQGMRTRSARTQNEKSKPLKQVTLSVLQRTLKEGQRLLKLSRQDKDIQKSVSDLEEEIDRIERKRLSLDALIDGSDISCWIAIDVSNHELLWVYKLELGFSIKKLLSESTGLKVCLFRDQIEGVKAAVHRLRIEHSLVKNILRESKIEYEEIEKIVNHDPYGGTDSGVLQYFSDQYLKAQKILKQRIVGLPVSQLEEWLNSVSDIPGISTQNQESVVNAKFVLSEASSLMESMSRMFQVLGVDKGQLGIIFPASLTIRAKNISSSLSVLLAKLDELSQVVVLSPSWVAWLRTLDWAVRAQQPDMDINALIELHRDSEVSNVRKTSESFGDSQVGELLTELDKKVSTITGLIKSAVEGDFFKLRVLDGMGLVASETERVKLDLEDMISRISMVENIRSGEITQKITISGLQATIESVSEFSVKYGKDIDIDDMAALVVANSKLSELKTRDEVEETLEKLLLFESDEILRAKKNLEKTKELESEVEQVVKKSDTVNTSVGRLVELGEQKYQLLRKASKLKIGLSQRGLRKLLFSLHSTLSYISQHTAVKPRWTYLFILKAVGTFIQQQQGSSLPTLPWLTRQLDACTEILKDAKKNLSDFAKTRFMVPLFHVSLFEPLEKIKQNMEQKMGVSIMLNYAQSERRLESVSSHDKEGRVKERIFPKLGGPSKSALIEPENSNIVSDFFSNRRPVIESFDQAVDQLLLVAKHQLQEWRDMLGQSSGKLKSGSQNSDSQSGMSFTKFLSSSFANLELNAVPDTDLVAPADNGKSYLDRYYEVVQNAGSKKSAPVSSVTTPRSTAYAAKMPEFKPPSALPGFAAPPKAVAAPPAERQQSSPEQRLIVWKGDIVGPKHAFRIPVCLVPLFRSPHPSAVRSVLANHQNWQFEGSLNIGKFAEHYAKLLHPQHRAKREPYSFYVASELPERVLECVPPNTASAFTLIVAPYKIKLWIVCGDGSVPFNPLPLVPRLFFAFVEMPLPLLNNAGALENIVEVAELAARANAVAGELMALQLGPLIQSSEPEHVQPVKQQRIEPPPQQVQVAPPEEDPLMARVLHAFSKQPPKQQSFQPLPAPMPRQPSRNELPPTWPQAPPPGPPATFFNPMTAYYARPIGGPSAMPSMVIGAPSAGPKIEELPNPKKGLCRFFNSSHGCQSGNRCRFIHACSVCNSEEHGSVFHDKPAPGFYRY